MTSILTNILYSFYTYIKRSPINIFSSILGKRNQAEQLRAMYLNYQPNLQICKSCYMLTLDVLSGNTLSQGRWRYIQSENTKFSYTTSHLNGKIQSLQNSALKGCQVCNLILKTINNMTDSKTANNYSLFVWHGTNRSARVEITTNDITKFTLHVSKRPPSKTLMFYQQSKDASNLLNLSINVVSEYRPSISKLPDSNQGTSQNFQQVRNWLTECTNVHAECGRSESKLPKRVLDIGEPESELKVSIYLTKNEVHNYVALSYTWGETDRLVTQRTSNEDLLHSINQFPYIVKQIKRKPNQSKDQRQVYFHDANNIPLDAFPKTLRDALYIAKALRFRYIWIDSLCILQGDDHDWATQGAAMTDIYGNSTLVISATSSDSSICGILNNLPNNDKISTGLGLVEANSHKVQEVLIGDPLKILDLEEKFISTRGWVFQERLVSTATLHYTDEGMVWECAHGIFTCHDQAKSNLPWKLNWREIMVQQNPLPIRTIFDVWYDWICAYSERDLYNSQDKFPAIAGIAKRYATVFGLSHTSYTAGLWKEDFLSGLLWRRHNRTSTLLRLRERYIAPSWSWGSVQGRLEYRKVFLYDSDLKGRRLRVSNIHVIEEHEASFGRITESYIHVSGLLQAVTIDRHNHPGVRQKPFQECGITTGFLNNQNVLCTLDCWKEDDSRFYDCWCLRIGSHNVDGREGDSFLLLDHIPGTADEYCRIGFAETDSWWDRMFPTPNSGILSLPEWKSIMIR